MLSPQERREVTSRIKTLVAKHHFNSGKVDLAAWARLVDEQTDMLLAADEVGFEEGIRKLLSELKCSHTGFFHIDSQPSRSQHSIGATLRSVGNHEGAQWMFLDVFEDSPAARAGIKPGHLLISVNDAACTPPSLPSFRFGEQHSVALQSSVGGTPRRVVVAVPQRKPSKRRPPLVEPKAVSHRMITSNVGLVKVPFFSGAFGIRFANLLDSAVESLKVRGCDRLVIDLRGCIGGSLGFARLVSYLSPDRIPIGFDITRKRLKQGYAVAELPRVPMPDSRFGLILCLTRFSVQDKSLVLLTQGLGKQPFHGRIVILVNEWTSSAGEMAAQFAKDTKLATLIGQRTMGYVLGATSFSVGHGYKLHLPIFGWYRPDGSYTEGGGVEPDVSVDVEPESLSQGHDAQLTRALEILR